MTKDITHNFKKLVRNQCTSEELEEVMAMIHDDQYADVYASLIAEELAMPVSSEEIDAGLRDRLNLRLQHILMDAEPVEDLAPKGKYSKPPGSAIKKLWPRIAVTAAAVAAITLGTWLYYGQPVLNLFQYHSGEGRNPGNAQYVTDIAPGKNRATLTLGDGQTISLSDQKSGVVIHASKLTYSDGTAIASQSASRNNVVVETPRGGTYQVVLPDGTRVWLNAASKITFPSQFDGPKREVTIVGEIYFEVAKNQAKPFIVKSQGQQIEVLGTVFNISSYMDERAVATTLLEGSVRVTAEGKTVVIKPGEQVVQEGQTLRVGQANLESALDWKNGDIVLDDVDLKTALRKIARWYDIEVVYEPSVTDNIKSGGWISRDTKLSEVLALIEKSGQVTFKLEGRRLRVMR